MDSEPSAPSVLDAPASSEAPVVADNQAAPAADTAPVTWETSPLARIYNPDGTQKEGAADALKELGFSDLSGVMLRNGAPFFDFAKQARDARATLSQKQEGVIRIPGADATPEQHTEFRKGLGALNTADEYSKALWPDDIGEGIVKDEGLISLASEWAAENPVLTPDSMKALTTKFVAFQEERVGAYKAGLQAAATEAAKETKAVLISELGGQAEFDTFSSQAKEFLSGQVAKEFGFDFKKDDTGKLYTENDLHQSMVNDPSFLRLLRSVVKDSQPASLPGAGSANFGAGGDSARLKELISKMGNGTMTSPERSEYNAARGIRTA